MLTIKQVAMKTIAIVSDKGGAGKTIVSVNLAVAAERHGLATVIFDFDPRANSAVWGDARPDKIPEVIPAQAPRLAVLLEQAKKNDAALVVLDTPGNALGIAEAVCPQADLILIPCRPFPPDLLSIVPTVRIALRSGKPTFVLLNAAPVQGPEVEEAISAIGRAQVGVCPVVLYNRKSYASRFHQGLTAYEADPRGKAVKELQALFMWACQETGLSIEQHDNKATPQLVAEIQG